MILRATSLAPIALAFVGCFGESPTIEGSSASASSSGRDDATSATTVSTSGETGSSGVADSSGGGVTSTSSGSSADDSGSSSGGPDCMPPPMGLRAWWRFEGSLEDETHAADGVPVGVVGYAPGRFGQALALDGSAYVDIGDPASLALGAEPFTVEGWVRVAPGVTGAEADAALISRMAFADPTANADGWMVVIQRDLHDWWFCLGASDNGCVLDNGTVAASDQPVVERMWTHVAATRDGEALRLYVDGVPFPALATAPQVHDVTGITIGASMAEQPDAGAFFQGLIDELTIYDRALSLDEIIALASAPTGKCPPP